MILAASAMGTGIADHLSSLAGPAWRPHLASRLALCRSPIGAIIRRKCHKSCTSDREAAHFTVGGRRGL
jgi:hypothetical protein